MKTPYKKKQCYPERQYPIHVLKTQFSGFSGGLSKFSPIFSTDLVPDYIHRSAFLFLFFVKLLNTAL